MTARLRGALLASGLLAFVIAACSSGSTGDGEPVTLATEGPAPATVPVSMGPGTERLVVDLAIPAHDELAAHAAALATAAAQCSDRTALQDAWRQTRLAWDSARIYTFAPQVEAHLVAKVDYWPIDRQRVEAVLAGPGSFTTDDYDQLGAGATGLPVIELVLFGDDPLGRRQCSYVARAAESISEAATEVSRALEDRSAELIDTLGIGDTLSMLSEAVYLMADEQLGMPAGLRTGVADPTLVHGLDGGMAMADLAAQLAAVEAAHQAALAPVLAERFPDEPDVIQASIDRAEGFLASLGDDLFAALDRDPAIVMAASEAVRDVRRDLVATATTMFGVSLNIASGDGD